MVSNALAALSYSVHSAAEDISQADEVRALVKDLWDVRLAKLRKSVDHMMTEQETYGKVGVCCLATTN